MGGVPLVALGVKGPLDLQQQAREVQGQGINNQLGQQSIQENQLKMQQQQAQIAATKYITQTIGQNGGDLGKALPQLAGKIPYPMFFDLQKTHADMLEKADKHTLDQNTIDAANMDKLAGLVTQGQQLPPDQYAAAWPDIAKQAVALEPKLADHINPGQPIPQAALEGIKVGFQTQGQISAQAAAKQKAKVEDATIQKDAADAAKANAEAAAKAAETEFYKQNGGAPGVPIETQQMTDALKKNPGMTASDYPSFKAAKIAQAELPQKFYLAKAEAMMRQSVSDGDPNSAAQLLTSGMVAPSQLISSRKPAFAQQAFAAAQKLDPTWNAQSAEANFKVANSPSQVAFFGSAKSLTDKGGTLDQLAEAAKAIPGNQIPAFNSIEDALKTAAGSGPLAKYASLLVGVADDYSKVMGGGTGSDSSRAQGFKLAAASASPAQRAASIEGIRGAVGSQINSRIGKNPVLKQMYAPDTGAAGASGASSPQFAVGQTVNVRGKIMKVTAVHPDGTFDAQ